MTFFQTGPQHLLITELHVPGVLLGLTGAVYAPSPLDVTEPSFLQIMGTSGPIVS